MWPYVINESELTLTISYKIQSTPDYLLPGKWLINVPLNEIFLGFSLIICNKYASSRRLPHIKTFHTSVFHAGVFFLIVMYGVWASDDDDDDDDDDWCFTATFVHMVG